jgi:hypothetical protein
MKLEVGKKYKHVLSGLVCECRAVVDGQPIMRAPVTSSLFSTDGANWQEVKEPAKPFRVRTVVVRCVAGGGLAVASLTDQHDPFGKFSLPTWPVNWCPPRYIRLLDEVREVAPE